MQSSGLTPCVQCARHMRLDESTCPHCGAAIGKSDGRRAVQTAAALMLGLGLAAGGAACAEEIAVYGAPDTSTSGPGGAGGQGTGGDGGSGGDAGGAGGAGGT